MKRLQGKGSAVSLTFLQRSWYWAVFNTFDCHSLLAVGHLMRCVEAVRKKTGG